MLDKLFPVNTFRRRVVKKLANTLGRESFDAYSNWAFEQSDKIKFIENTGLTNRPLISIVVPAYNTPSEYLYPFVYSVVGQYYDNWELVVVNASTDVKYKKMINRIDQIDDRITVVETKNNGISANTNIGIELSKGEFIGFMDHDDVLSLDALYEVVKVINSNPDVALIYSDEDKLTEDGVRYRNPHYKPDWSPDLLTHVNYITHFTVARRKLIKQVGGLDSQKDGAQDYDLVLKISDVDNNVVHISKILYHWREAKNSTAQSISNKTYIKSAGERALKDHYNRKEVDVNVKALANKPGFYDVTYKSKNPTLIVPPFATDTLIELYLEVLAQKNTLQGLKVISFIKSTRLQKDGIVYIEKSQFIQNALEISDDYALIINDFIIPESPDWASRLSGRLTESHVHSVSPIIVRQDGSIEDCGIIASDEEMIKLFKGYRFGVNTYFGDTDWTRNVDSTTGKVVAVRTHELQEMLENSNTFGDIRTMLHEFTKDRKSNKYNVVTASPKVVHVRSSQQHGKSGFMNPGIHQSGPDFYPYPSDQQILDALLAVKGQDI